MNIWVITWRWSDGSGSGALPWAFTDEVMADLVLDLLRLEGSKEYQRVSVSVVEAKGKTTFDPRSVGVVPMWGQQWWKERIGGLPHEGVHGVTPLDHTMLTVRTLNALKAEGIETIEQLVCWKEQWLLMVPNLGRKSLNEIKEYLHSKGLKLKGQT